MPVSIGIVLVVGSCITGYLLSGGDLLALWQPFELIIIGGAAFGAMVVSHPMHVTIPGKRIYTINYIHTHRNKASAGIVR